MKPTHVVITTMLLITAFCIFFGWYLYKMCRRAIDAEHYELACRGGGDEMGMDMSAMANSTAAKSTKSGGKSGGKSAKSAKSAKSTAKSGGVVGAGTT